MQFSTSRKFVISVVLFHLVVKVNSQDPALVTLTSRVYQLEGAENATRTEISNLWNRYYSVSDQFWSDVSNFNRRIDTIAKNLSIVHVEVYNNTVGIADAASKIAALMADLPVAEGKITKLQSVNLIWQKNFRVVNKTFAELRRKVRFVVPSRLLRVIPLVYGGGGIVLQRPKQKQKPVNKKPVKKGKVTKANG